MYPQKNYDMNFSPIMNAVKFVQERPSQVQQAWSGLFTPKKPNILLFLLQILDCKGSCFQKKILDLDSPGACLRVFR